VLAGRGVLGVDRGVTGAGELADAGGDAHADVVDQRGAPELDPGALEHDAGLPLLGLRHQQGELVAADTRQQTRPASTRRPPGSARRAASTRSRTGRTPE